MDYIKSPWKVFPPAERFPPLRLPRRGRVTVSARSLQRLGFGFGCPLIAGLYGRTNASLTEKIMYSLMLFSFNNNKIFRSVIKTIKIQMMDYFIFGQFPSKGFFRNNSMIENSDSINPVSRISLLGNVSAFRGSSLYFNGSIAKQTEIMSLTQLLDFVSRIICASLYATVDAWFYRRPGNAFFCISVSTPSIVMHITKSLTRIRKVATFDRTSPFIFHGVILA